MRILVKDKKDKNTKDYLQCILKINQGRNILDNNVSKHNSNARILFEEVLEIFDNADFEIKDELKDLATISYNNLGIYYLNEGFIYEEAEEQFKKAYLLTIIAHMLGTISVYYTIGKKNTIEH